MPDRLTPPFTVHQTDEAAWIEDAEGKGFGFCYWRTTAIIGTDRSGRLSRDLALKTVRWIKLMAEEAARGAARP